MKLLILLAGLVGVSNALHPVKDFRVDDFDLGTSKSTKVTLTKGLVKGVGVGVGGSSGDGSAGLGPYLVPLVSSASNLASSAPTIELDDDVQMVYTDDSSSIYYINSSVESQQYHESFPLLLDTGSSVTWIYNESCSDPACQQSQVQKFSSNFGDIDTKLSFQLSYSSQYVKGNIVSSDENDLKFQLNGLELDDFSFGLTGNAPDLFNGFDVSGILGVPSSNNKSVDRNIIYQLQDQDVIDKEVFSLSLVGESQAVEYKDSEGNSNLPQNYGGLILFGSKARDYASRFAHNDVHYTDIISNDNDYWLVDFLPVKVVDSQGQSQSWNGSVRSSIIDTGSTGMVLPKKDAMSIHEMLFGDDLISDNKGNFAFPCDSSTPAIKLTVDGHEFSVSADDFKGKEYTDSEQLSGYCASMIQGLEGYEDWVFGAAFLRKFYTIFDLENERIGFADGRIDKYSLTKKSGTVVNSTNTNTNSTSTNTNSTSTNTNTTESSSSSSSSASSASSTSSSSSSSSSSPDTASSSSTIVPPWLLLILSLCIFI